MKLIPILGMFAVFFASNTALTWSIIKLSRAEDRFKWLRVAEQLFAAKVALSNRELNAKAWQRLSDIEKTTLRASGFNIDNIESSAFGKELLQEATNQKIGARDLLPHLRNAKSPKDVEDGIKRIGGANWQQDVSKGVHGVASSFKPDVDGINSLKTVSAVSLGKAGELDEEQLKKLQENISKNNQYNNFQQFYSGLSPQEKKRFDEASDDEKRAMLEEFGLKSDLLAAAEEELPGGSAVELAEDELEQLDADELDRRIDEEEDLRGLTFADDNEDAILQYARGLDDDDYAEALGEAQLRLGDRAVPDTVQGTIDGAPIDPEMLRGMKGRLLKEGLKGKDFGKLLNAQKVEPASVRDGLESELITAERALKQRAKALEQLKSDDVAPLFAGSDDIEPDMGSLMVALRDKNTSAGHARTIMRLKSNEFSGILKNLDPGAAVHARNIRYGNWLEQEMGTLQGAQETPDIRVPSRPLPSLEGNESRFTSMTPLYEDEYRHIMDDPEIRSEIKELLRDSEPADQDALSIGGEDEDEWFDSVLASPLISDDDKKKLIVKIKHERTDRIDNPATPESHRRRLLHSLENIEADFKRRLEE